MGSAQTELAEQARTCEEFGAKADYDAKQGDAAIPERSKGDKSVAGSLFGHFSDLIQPNCNVMLRFLASGGGCGPVSLFVGASGSD